MIEACVVFSIVGVVPAVLHIFSGKRNGSKAKMIIYLILDIIACILQVAGLIGTSVLIYKKHGKPDTVDRDLNILLC